MVCNILPLFDRKLARTAFYLDMTENLKGVRLKSEYSNQILQDLYKGANSP